MGKKTKKQKAVGQTKTQTGLVPKCPGCRGPLHEVQFMDYGDIRVVFHTIIGCVVGCMPVPKE